LLILWQQQAAGLWSIIYITLERFHARNVPNRTGFYQFGSILLYVEAFHSINSCMLAPEKMLTKLTMGT
jgi:hypothetical protein